MTSGRQSPARSRLADIAQQAGVSIASVSYALNGEPGVSAATRRRILDVAESLNYRPNRHATTLRTGESRVFGLTVPELSNPFSSELAAGVLKAATASGYGVFVVQADLGVPLPSSQVDALLGHEVAGLVTSSLVDEDRDLLLGLLERQVPVVQVIRRVEGVDTDFVGIDDVTAARLEVDHLLKLGRRDLAIATGPQNSSAQRARLSGYRSGLTAAGHKLPPERLAIGALTRRGGYDATVTIIRAASGPPDAVLCGNDLMAIGAIDALIDHGLRVPEDVAVAGYDDMSLASSRLIGLTTIRVPRRRLGAAAVDLLLRRIADPAATPQTVLLPHNLVVRRTCGSPPPTIS